MAFRLRAIPRRHSRGLLGVEGSAAVEMALITPFLLIFLFGAVDYGVMTNQQSALEGATRAGAEYARAVYPSTTGIGSQVTGADQMFGTTITPSNSSFCTCVNATVVTCPTNPPAQGWTNPCASVTNPYSGVADSRILTYVVVTATQNYAAPVPWGNLAPDSQTLKAGTVARVQ